VSDKEHRVTDSLMPVVRGELVSRSTSLVRRGLALLNLRQPIKDENRIAAVQRDARAELELGLAYEVGNGVPKDYAEAAN